MGKTPTRIDQTIVLHVWTRYGPDMDQILKEWSEIKTCRTNFHVRTCEMNITFSSSSDEGGIFHA
jgi:hypothetical protein